MSNPSIAEETFWVKTALTKLESEAPLPLHLDFLPKAVNDRPDTCSASQYGAAEITTPDQREETTQNLQALLADAQKPKLNM